MYSIMAAWPTFAPEQTAYIGCLTDMLQTFTDDTQQTPSSRGNILQCWTPYLSLELSLRQMMVYIQLDSLQYRLVVFQNNLTVSGPESRCILQTVTVSGIPGVRRPVELEITLMFGPDLFLTHQFGDVTIVAADLMPA